MIQTKAIILNSHSGNNQFSQTIQKITITSSDVLIKLLCFSADPVMKFWAAGTKTYYRKVQIGDVFNCFGLGVVLQGNQTYPKGTYIFGNIGTAQYSVLDQSRQNQCFQVPKDIVESVGYQKFLYLINNGLAAACCLDIFRPKEGQSVVVSTAAGATGILVCQLLKKKGLKVIGLTSKNKMKEIRNICDIVVDYGNGEQLKKVLKENPFEHYFDNVGDWLLDMILRYMKPFGKIALCGAISNYNDYGSRGINNYSVLISKRIKMEGLAFMYKFGQIKQVFSEFEGLQMKIININSSQFNQYFNQIVSPGNSVVGKVIVKFGEETKGRL